MAADEPLIAHAGPFKLPGNGGGTLTWDERQEIKSFTGVSAAVRDRKQTGGVRHLTLSGPVQNMSTAKKMAMEFVLRSQIASVPFVATPKANGDWEATERQPSKKQATSSSNGSSSNLTWQQGMRMQHGGMPAMFQGHMPMQWPPGMMMPMQYPGMPMQYPGLPPPSMMMPMHMPMMYPPPQKEVAPETSDDDDVVDDEWCSNHLGSTAKAAGATAALKPTWGVPAKVHVKQERQDDVDGEVGVGKVAPIKVSPVKRTLQSPVKCKAEKNRLPRVDISDGDDDDDEEGVGQPTPREPVVRLRPASSGGAFPRRITSRAVSWSPSTKQPCQVEIKSVGWRQQGADWSYDFDTLMDGLQNRLNFRGIPEAHLAVDCRQFKDHYLDKSFLYHTGYHNEFLKQTVEHAKFPNVAKDVLQAVKDFCKGNKDTMRILMVCTSGCHRSVSLTLVMQHLLEHKGYTVNIGHLSKGSWEKRCRSCKNCDWGEDKVAILKKGRDIVG
jgi:hypothetical protein